MKKNKNKEIIRCQVCCANNNTYIKMSECIVIDNNRMAF